MPAKYKFGEYSSYSTMIKYMRTVEFYFPTLVNLIRIGVSHEGRPIEGLKIGNPTTDGSIKRAFWVDGNIHAREWPSSHTALFVINQLVSGYGKDKFITHFLNHFDVYIFPVLNPDGLEYSRSSTNPTIRLWRKNRSPRKCSAGAWGGIKCCQGVDLNRNFDFFWSESGSSENPCSNQYQGSGPISEPESKAVHDFMTSDEMKGRFDGFITLHTYAQLFIHPYSHEYNNYPPDIADISKVAHKAINRLRAVYGTDYRYGTGADLLSPASGGSDDWAKSMLKIKYVYLIELRPEMELSGGFILNKEELIPTGIETFEAIKVVMEACLIKNKMPIRPPHLEDIKQRDDILGKFVPKNSELEKRILAKDDSLLNLPLPQKHNEVVKEEKVETSQSVPSTTAYPFDITNMFMNNGFDISTPNHKVTTNRPVMVHQVSTTTDRNWPKWTAWARMTRPVVETTEATTTTTIPTTTTTRLIATSTTTESTISVDNQHLSEMLFRKQLQRLKTEERLKSDEEEPVQVIDIRYEEEETYKPNIDETLSLPESVTISTPAKIAPNIVTLTKPKITIQPIKPSYQNIVKEECEDNQRSCTIWIKSRPNVCIKHSRFMKIQCRKGCHFCQTSN
uniref:ShKT domain-containing protein n=1 Tax=Rhabditophanes sp. KR3021 TaxID=114890 RepID=A0AC35TFR8_9BILA